jgi:hypothetical protein
MERITQNCLPGGEARAEGAVGGERVAGRGGFDTLGNHFLPQLLHDTRVAIVYQLKTQFLTRKLQVKQTSLTAKGECLCWHKGACHCSSWC